MNKRAVLIVEDNPTDEALLFRALNKAGLTNPIITVKDGLDFVRRGQPVAGPDACSPTAAIVVPVGDVRKLNLRATGATGILSMYRLVRG